MQLTLLKGKIHRATVTQGNLHYIGSLTLDEDLMEAADLLPGEQVAIVDVTNGARLETYLIAGERGSGVVGINGAAAHLGPVGAGVAQLLIAIYGGYFGGGIGFLMLAALTMAGLPTRNAGATKNVLAGVMNASAVLLFITSPLLHWLQALVLGGGAILGGLAGAWALQRVNERALRIAIVCIGLALTVGLFLKPL